MWDQSALGRPCFRRLGSRSGQSGLDATKDATAICVFFTRILTATFYGPPEPYDSNIIILRNATELGDLIRKADVDGKPLFILAT